VGGKLRLRGVPSKGRGGRVGGQSSPKKSVWTLTGALTPETPERGRKNEGGVGGESKYVGRRKARRENDMKKKKSF